MEYPYSGKYDPYNSPKSLDLGRLTEDRNDLLKVIDGANDPVVTDFINLEV